MGDSYNMHTAFGTIPGQVSQAGQLAMQQRLQEQRMAAQAQIAALQQQGETSRQGTFDQRSAGDMNMLRERGGQEQAAIGLRGDQDVRAITAGQAPEMARFGLEKQLFDEGTNLRQAQNQGAMGKLGLQNFINGQAQAFLRGKMGGAGGAGGFNMTPDDMDQFSGVMSLVNGGPGVDLGQRKMERQRQTLMMEGDLRADGVAKGAMWRAADQPQKAREAEARGAVPPQLEDLDTYMGRHSDYGAGLGKVADQFIEQDRTTFGDDPGEDGITKLNNEINRIAQQLRLADYPTAAAIQKAKAIVRAKLKASQGEDGSLAHANDGWIQEAIKRLDGM